jgi:hypothetical protein
METALPDVEEAGTWMPFPSTEVLDDFERGGELGEAWDETGLSVSEYMVEDGWLLCTNCSFYEPLLWGEAMGPQQEVFATLTNFGSIAPEISLVLLAQGGACNHVQVVYSPKWQYIAVDHCDESHPNFDPESWKKTRPLQPGDRLGARVLAGNQIEVFVNEERFAVVDLSDFPFTSGSIGVIAFSDANTTVGWDDFGGGEY